MWRQLGVGALLVTGALAAIIWHGEASEDMARAPVLPVTRALSIEPAHGVPGLVVAASSNAVSKESQPHQRTASLDGATDLWTFANKALSSEDPGILYEGLAAARECVGFMGLQPELLNMASGGPSMFPHPLTPDRQIAIQKIIARCNGFIRAGAAGNADLLKKIREKGERTNFAGFWAPAKGESAHQAYLQVLVLSSSSAAVELGLPMLVDHWIAASGVTDDRQQMLMSLAGRVSLCGLGKDCGPDSYSTHLQCALAGACFPNS